MSATTYDVFGAPTESPPAGHGVPGRTRLGRVKLQTAGRSGDEG